MKKIMISFGLFLTLCLSASISQANVTDAAHKLKDGLKDVITSPINVYEVTSDQLRRTKGDGIWRGQTLGFTAGIMEGSASMVTQLFQGVIKIVTFPVN